MITIKVHVNYNIGEILNKIDRGQTGTELLWLKTKIDKYKSGTEYQIKEALEKLQDAAPENPMRWITENVEKVIQYYVRCEIQGKSYNVLMRNNDRWKTVSDIGITVEPQDSVPIDYNEWISKWKSEANNLAALHMPVYETHAHYNHENFRQVKENLVPLLHESGIQRCIVPAIEFKTCSEMKEMFDLPEFDWIYYAFGSHPKYLWKECWTEETWNQLEEFVDDPKCVAVGEAGLDYSYKNFDGLHRQNQRDFFNNFIELANRHHLPLILHIRLADISPKCEYDATADAIEILRDNSPLYGAILHCFCGNWEEACHYMEVGVKYFGIGGRICYGDPKLEHAVQKLPEESILLETDAPYIKIGNDGRPNTSISLLQIAEKIAAIRETSVAHILDITYKNAQNLFGV